MVKVEETFRDTFSSPKHQIQKPEEFTSPVPSWIRDSKNFSTLQDRGCIFFFEENINYETCQFRQAKQSTDETVEAIAYAY